MDKFKTRMKSVLFLYTGSDSTKAEKLKNYFQVSHLRGIADFKSITDILAEELDFSWELCNSGCVVLIGSRQASFLIQNKRQETEDEFITFDGKIIHDEFTENKELVRERLIIIFFTERTKNDWIPTGFNERRVFHVPDGKVPPDGSPTLDQIQYCIKTILFGNDYPF